MIQIWLEWLEFEFERFEFGSNGLNLHSNASNPFRMVRIYIRMLKIWFEFPFKCKSLSNV